MLCPYSWEEGQPAELLAGQFCFELVAQGGVFLVLDHLGTQQERLDLAGKASRQSHEPLVGGLTRRHFKPIFMSEGSDTCVARNT